MATATFSFAPILNQIIAHEGAHPDHGTDCSCMDPLIRQVRQALPTGVGAIPTRLRYVIHTATKH